MNKNLSEISVTPVALASATAPRQPVGSMPCQGNWYRLKDKKPKTAIIAAHYSADMSGHFLANRMAARGYGFLGWNTRFRSGEEMFDISHALIDLAAGVEWLRAQDVQKIVLLGNSGGGSLMATYQSQASARTLTKGRPAISPLLDELVPGDFYVSLNAHAGRPEYLASIMDPAVTDEFDPTATDSSLDMFDPANGPPYSPEFVKRYRAAQVARNHRITQWALVERERIAEKGYSDRLFTVPRVWADLRFLDGTLDPSDRKIGICYGGDPRSANHGVLGMARATTIKTWLSLWSLEHSLCRSRAHLENVTVPGLVIQTMADIGVFPSDAHTIHDMLAADDKTIIFRPGTHFLDVPDTARDDVTETIVSWLQSRGA